MNRKPRTEAQEVEIMRRWIYRAFDRELQRWFMAHAPQRIPMNANSYAQVLNVCLSAFASSLDPDWSIDIIEPDAEARARRMGSTVVLCWRGMPV